MPSHGCCGLVRQYACESPWSFSDRFQTFGEDLHSLDQLFVQLDQLLVGQQIVTGGALESKARSVVMALREVRVSLAWIGRVSEGTFGDIVKRFAEGER